MPNEHTQGYMVHPYEMDYEAARNVLMATRSAQAVLKPYQAYAQVYSEAESESMPSHGPQDLAIELLNGKLLPWGPFYNLSKK
jgi:hypothetical protein